MMDDGPKLSIVPPVEVPLSGEKLEEGRVTLVYTMYHHLGDFVVIGGLLKKFELLKVEFQSLVAHRGSPHVSSFRSGMSDPFFNVSRMEELIGLITTLRRQRKAGRTIMGIPMAPGSIQAFGFFWLLKKLGALTYIVDFNLINADILTPVRKRYVFDRHLAQAAEIFKRPDWMEDTSMPLAVARPAMIKSKTARRIGIFPWSGRRHLPEFQWPDSRWLELAKLILKIPGTEVALLGRDEEFVQFEQTLRAGLPEDEQTRLVSLRATSVENLVGSIQNLDVLVTLNTSALHIAHALKLPTITLCGSSGGFWLPEGEHIRIVRDTRGVLPPSDQYAHDPLQPSLQRIAVTDVFSAFEDLFQQIGPKA